MASIVVGYEGSEQAARVLERAAGLAEALSATLIVVSVAAPSGQSGAPTSAARPNPIEGLIVPPHHSHGGDDTSTPEEPERRQALERARSALAGRALKAEYVIEVGDPAERLLAVAVERGSELIVVGRGEHGILERLRRRPAEEAVARHADCDVLIVH